MPEPHGAPSRYKLLDRGPFGAPPLGVPYDAHRQALHVVDWLQRQLDWAHGVEMRWFASAGLHDWDGDPGVFAAEHPLLGCVDPKAPTEARLNVALARGPMGPLIRTTVHEALHAEELARGLGRRLTHQELEVLTEDLVGLLCRGVPG